MNCMFCQSELSNDAVLKEGLDDRVAGQKTFPIEYNCPKCIHVWVTETCVQRFPLDPFFHDPERRMILSRCIRERCQQSQDNRLQGALSIQALNMMWLKR